MLGYIGVTDYEWFQFLSSEPPLDEVNFWRPSDLRSPKQLIPGTPFLFKLKARHGDQIVGFGTFARHEILPLWLAWDTFGRKNGGPDFAGFRRQIARLRGGASERDQTVNDFEIGCILLSEPVWFHEADWVAPPANWPANAVQGKGYDISSGEAARVWQACLQAAAHAPNRAMPTDLVSVVPEAARYGQAMPVAPRLGQGTFRLAVTSAYGRACTVTGDD